MMRTKEKATIFIVWEKGTRPLIPLLEVNE